MFRRTAESYWLRCNFREVTTLSNRSYQMIFSDYGHMVGKVSPYEFSQHLRNNLRLLATAYHSDVARLIRPYNPSYEIQKAFDAKLRPHLTTPSTHAAHTDGTAFVEWSIEYLDSLRTTINSAQTYISSQSGSVVTPHFRPNHGRPSQIPTNRRFRIQNPTVAHGDVCMPTTAPVTNPQPATALAQIPSQFPMQSPNQVHRAPRQSPNHLLSVTAMSNEEVSRELERLRANPFTETLFRQLDSQFRYEATVGVGSIQSVLQACGIHAVHGACHAPLRPPQSLF
jgi:cell division septation protein DedD